MRKYYLFCSNKKRIDERVTTEIKKTSYMTFRCQNNTERNSDQNFNEKNYKISH